MELYHSELIKILTFHPNGLQYKFHQLSTVKITQTHNCQTT